MMHRFYRFLTIVLEPLVKLHLKRRVRRHKEDPARLDERMGIPSRDRPPGYLVWCHAASVGEARSLLALITRLTEKRTDLKVLVTTGTRTSAELMARELPANCIHQYVPVDCYRWVQRFYEHWHPNLVLWLESELWPNLILSAPDQSLSRTASKILVNARISDQSFKKWGLARGLVGTMLKSFDMIFAQSESDEKKFLKLGAFNTKRIENLKYANPPLDADERQLKILQEKTRTRPVWIAASTHPGEEEIVARAHQRLAASFPHLLTIIIPRHPERGFEITAALREMTLNVRTRSFGETVRHNTDIYVADTLGELGLFFRVSEIVFVGGSLVPIGGHNLLEPAQLISAILTGPYMHNFSKLYDDFKAANAVVTVENEIQLADHVANLLSYATKRKKLARAATQQASKHLTVLDDIVTAVERFLPRV